MFGLYVKVVMVGALFAAPSATVFAGNRWSVSGVAHDSATGEVLPAVNVRALGTSHGTISNDVGEFILDLDAGHYTLAFSTLGYRPDTVTLQLDSPKSLDVRLTAADILFPEIVVTAEDPAIEIIRRAIERKRIWFDRLYSYSFDAFTRQSIYRDTEIAGIAESFTRGYWRQGDTLREVVTQRRQTENIPSGYNFASVGRMLNFNDDQLLFAGYLFVGPTALSALDYYDYKLIRTYALRGHEAYEIRMIPKTRTVPLFNGTVSIAGGSYALAGINVTPNEAFRIPFVALNTLRYRQQFSLFDSLFWMPTDIRIDASATISFLGFSIPPIGIHQTSVITDYTINTPVPDSIFGKPRLVIDSSAARIDTAFWRSNNILPLNRPEREAYQTLDSTKTMEVQFRPSGMAVSLGVGSDSSSFLNALSWVDATFNRVEGFHLGLEKEIDSLPWNGSIRAGAAYGFATHRWSYTFGTTVYSSARRTLGLGGLFYDRVDHIPDGGYYSPLTVGLAALLGKEDYRDYFRAKGWTLFITGSPATIVTLKAGYVHEEENSEIKRTDYSLFYPSRRYRDNPAIANGALRSLTAWVRIGPPPVPLDLIMQNFLELSIEQSTPSLLNSDFHFSRLTGVASLSAPTFGRSYLFPPTLSIRASAGKSWGDLPPQRLFNVESKLDGYGPLGTMLGLSPRELTGTSMVAITMEHNFRSLPFLALGIPFLYESSIELILHGGAARVWGMNTAVNGSGDTWYTEAGFGLSRLFDIIRVDFTWRLSRPKDFGVTVGVAQIL